MSAFTNSFSAMNDFRSQSWVRHFSITKLIVLGDFLRNYAPVSGTGPLAESPVNPSICAMGPSGFKWLAKIFSLLGAAPLAEDLPGFLLMYS